MNVLERCVLIALCFGFAGSARAAHSSLSYEVERVVVSGTSLGSFTDEFADGLLAPWTIDFGTATEAGGTVTLSDPGTHDVFTDGMSFGIPQDRSDIGLDPIAWDGLGDFTISSTWLSVTPPESQAFFHNVQTAIGPDSLANSIVGMTNASPEVAAIFGVSPGLQLFQLQNVDDPIGTALPGSIVVESLSILAGHITGDVVFRTSFDDTLDTFTHTVSLDGGSTFLSPFSPVDSLGGSGRFILSVNETLLPEPGAALLVLLSIGVGARAGAGGLRPGPSPRAGPAPWSSSSPPRMRRRSGSPSGPPARRAPRVG